MTDKPVVQQALAQNLADLTLDVRPRSKARNGRVERFRSALAYLRGFWEAIIREWSTLDHHRSVRGVAPSANMLPTDREIPRI